ncbi:MAG: SDR family oxidoreductase [Alphaproteobacteria bacterium]|nr:SDR family oxidoreductase [Alphaproteobacteria bacterium]MBV8549608.1 SDR family oxidoreductase [Alphaproteobacteria bacterium]
MDDDFSLSGKTVLVTGATSGIGRALAQALAQEGARVFATGRSRERLDQVLAELHGTGHGGETADLTDPDQITNLVNAAPELNGIVLNSGVIAKLRPFQMEDAAHMQEVMNVNFFGPVNLLNQLVKKKKVASGCSIVFNTSMASLIGTPATSAYAASKGALAVVAKSIANDLGRKKIRSNSVCFGYVQTEALMGSNVSSELFEAVPLGVPKPEEVVGPILYLLSDASRWVTRTTLIVDGGVTLKQSRTL